jgi:hypothetical protein
MVCPIECDHPYVVPGRAQALRELPARPGGRPVVLGAMKYPEGTADTRCASFRYRRLHASG